MERYVAAWDSSDPAVIAALFTEDADYRSYPWATPTHGTDGDRHFVQGRTAYADGRTYDNLWIVDLVPDGRASGFTEWYMEVSKPLGPNA